MTRSWR